ncbi:MAG: ATP-binding cassette domain-containing protein [Bacillota bacterium]
MTLTHLLGRYLDPDAGSVTLGGKPLRELPLDWVRSRVAIVPREPHLLPGSNCENLTLGHTECTEQELVQAAEVARVHDRIMALPNGYETRLQECGADLSAGEKQRLTLARAFLREATIIVMDEATSAIDAQLEDEIFTTFRERFADTTWIIIAHRLSTIMEADRILVLADGRIVEQGDHTNLINEGRVYPTLIASQLAVGG